MSYVFGPVPSRRLGRSLGIDPIPFKTCTYDCIYCQLGRTTNKTTERTEWFPLEAIVSELQQKLATQPDYITLGGSGEPTLYSRTGELIDRIRGLTDIPIAVLTNGSLLWNEDVRKQLMDAHVVIPSLDAGDAKTFSAVNRPHPDIAFEQMLEGLITFRSEYKGEYWLEVFLLADHTGTISAIRKLADCVRKINPDRVQINTVTRPPSEEYAVAVSWETLPKLAALFVPSAEVICDFRGIHQEGDFVSTREDIIKMLKRRPCTLDDIAGGLQIHRNEAIKHIEKLLENRLLERDILDGKTYYRYKASESGDV
jgi:wyosine [tRNA(Phe)-imidazoG37] synthetase (radical SAM superfamily)